MAQTNTKNIENGEVKNSGKESSNVTHGVKSKKKTVNPIVDQPESANDPEIKRKQTLASAQEQSDANSEKNPADMDLKLPADPKTGTTEEVISVPENFQKPIDRIDQLFVNAEDELNGEIKKYNAEFEEDKGEEVFAPVLTDLQDLRTSYRKAFRKIEDQRRKEKGV